MQSSKQLLIATISVVLVMGLGSCSMPQLQIKAPYKLKEKVSLGFQKAMIYELSDSLEAFAHQRYIPFYRYELQNEKGEVLQQYVGAVQEYLSRVAGSLRPEQKILVQAKVAKNKSDDPSLVVTTWSYPNYEGEVSDLGQSGNSIRTRYWSVDSAGTDKSPELFTTHPVSVPSTLSTLQLNRSAEELRQLRNEAEEYVYYEFKSFVLSRFRDQ